jgi:hypothetical protein
LASFVIGLASASPLLRRLLQICAVLYELFPYPRSHPRGIGAELAYKLGIGGGLRVVPGTPSDDFEQHRRQVNSLGSEPVLQSPATVISTRQGMGRRSKQTMQKSRTEATDENTRRKLNRSFLARRSNLRIAASSERLISGGHRRSADLFQFVAVCGRPSLCVSSLNKRPTDGYNQRHRTRRLRFAPRNVVPRLQPDLITL